MVVFGQYQQSKVDQSILAKRLTYNQFPAMQLLLESKEITEFPEFIEIPVLPLTLLGLRKLIKSLKQGKKDAFSHKQTKFQAISVVARVVQVEPTLILNDNTDVYPLTNPFMEQFLKPLCRSFYYRFFFELDQTLEDGLRIVKIESVLPEQTMAHLQDTLTEELFSQTYMKLYKDQLDAKATNEIKSNINKIKHTISRLNNQKGDFTVQDVVFESGAPLQDVQEIVNELCDEGKIMDLGGKYEQLGSLD